MDLLNIFFNKDNNRRKEEGRLFANRYLCKN